MSNPFFSTMGKFVFFLQQVTFIILILHYLLLCKLLVALNTLPNHSLPRDWMYLLSLSVYFFPFSFFQKGCLKTVCANNDFFLCLLGIFSFISFLTVFTTFACHVYEYHNQESWEKSYFNFIK